MADASAMVRKILTAREVKPFQQFGQQYDALTNNGATGCTDTCLQFLIRLWKGYMPTHDQIRQKAGLGYNQRFRGLRPPEVQAICRAYAIPYVVVTGMSADDVMRRSDMGPIGFGHSYSWWPEWRGRTYDGVTADGKPNWFARPYYKAGRTQLSGFVPPNDAHYGLLLGRDPIDKQIYSWEPNHNSPSRPEDPPWDELTYDQFRGVYNSYQRVLGRTLYALVPTKQFA